MLRWLLESVSTRGRSATYIITKITVCIKCQFLIKLVFPCSSFLSSFLHFVFLPLSYSLSLFVRRKIKEGLRKVQGTKFGPICLCISCVFLFYFLLRKGKECDIIWVKKERSLKRFNFKIISRNS